MDTAWPSVLGGVGAAISAEVAEGRSCILGQVLSEGDQLRVDLARDAKEKELNEGPKPHKRR